MYDCIVGTNKALLATGRWCNYTVRWRYDVGKTLSLSLSRLNSTIYSTTPKSFFSAKFFLPLHTLVPFSKTHFNDFFLFRVCMKKSSKLSKTLKMLSFFCGVLVVVEKDRFSSFSWVNVSLFFNFFLEHCSYFSQRKNYWNSNQKLKEKIRKKPYQHQNVHCIHAAVYV